MSKSALWASLPEELALKIVEYKARHWALVGVKRLGPSGTGPLERINLTSQFDRVLQFRRLNRAFAAGLRPVALCMVPVVHRNHAECIVEGVVRQALLGMTTDRYSSLYTVVYEGCTTRPPNNKTGHYYDVLTKLRPTLEKVLGNRSLSHQERRVAAGLLKSIFRYIDRSYTKHNDLKLVEELIEEAFESRLAL